MGVTIVECERGNSFHFMVIVSVNQRLSSVNTQRSGAADVYLVFTYSRYTIATVAFEKFKRTAHLVIDLPMIFTSVIIPGSNNVKSCPYRMVVTVALIVYL